MSEGNVIGKASRSIGDVAVDGLLRGVAAGLVMAAVLVLIGLLAQLPLQLVLSRFDPTGAQSAATGLLAHLATAGIYGLIFALLTAPVTGRVGGRMVLAGALYGLALWGVSRGLMASDLGAPLRIFPAWGWFAAHVAYGAVLGWLMGRR